MILPVLLPVFLPMVCFPLQKTSQELHYGNRLVR